MMDYELFKSVFVKRIIDYMPRDFKDHTPEVREVKKVNRIKDGFILSPPEMDPSRPMPTLYLDDIYEDFCVDEDLNRVLSNAAFVLMKYSGETFDEARPDNLKNMKDRVVMNLINRDMNCELLKDLPHREIMDLAIIYRLVVRTEEKGILSLMINHDVCREMGVDEEELYRLAKTNTRRIFPAKIIEDEGAMCIMTNDAVINGATTMLYRDDMKKLSEKIGGDFFILPSSVHEFFAIPTEYEDVGRLAAMLAGGNGNVTDWSEVLSGSIYLYSAERNDIRICAASVRPPASFTASASEFI